MGLNIPMISDNNIAEKFSELKDSFCYAEIGKLISKSLKINSSEFNRKVFGYIPAHFREIQIYSDLSNLNEHNIFIGEPVIYKILFPSSITMEKIDCFYIFCYIKNNSEGFNVFFQSASRASKLLTPKDYHLSSKKIAFEGVISAFENNLSFISVSDPGHFISGLYSSFYVGTQKLNFAQLISTVVEKIVKLAGAKLENTFLFGSSAGGMGALLSSSYFSSKVQVMSLNAQISTYTLSEPMKILLGTDNQEYLLDKFGERVCCMNRFKKDIASTPNIFLSANTNDSIYQKNYKFYQLYRKLFSGRGKNNQSVFDSYCGATGHGRPDKKSLKTKIIIARELLTMNSNPLKDDNQKLPTSKNMIIEREHLKIIKSYPKKAVRRKYIELADSLLREKRFEEAVYFYCQALKLNSHHSRVHASLGNALLNMNELDRAIYCYRRAIELNYNSPGAFKKMGDALQMKGNLDEAIVAYKRALKLKPNLFNICNLIGDILFQQGHEEKARQYYNAYKKMKKRSI